jgi:O-antigen/teichoic acid export membrane protein
VKRWTKPHNPGRALLGVVLSLGKDALLRNSLFLTLTTVAIAGFGFVFWLMNSRLFTAEQIGMATTLISGASLISYVSLFGFNTTFVRFLPTSRNRDQEINTGLLIVFATALVVAGAYVLLVPVVAPRLGFIRGSFGFAAVFVVLTAFWAVNLVTDSVFIALRKAQYNLLIDGFVQGAVKLALPVLVVGFGAFGIFMASGLAAAVAVVASVLFMMRVVKYKPKPSVSLNVLRRTWEYSAANYAANLLNLCPNLLFPLIVLDERGPRQAAYYFIAFQVAGLLFAAAYAVSASFFAESSYEGSHLPSLLRRSVKILTLVCVPSGILVAVAGRWLLLLFGHAYSTSAASALAVLALSTPAVGLYSAATTALRVEGRLREVVGMSATYAALIVGLTFLWADRGLQWVALAWLLGNAGAGLLAAGLAFIHLRAPGAGATEQAETPDVSGAGAAP